MYFNSSTYLISVPRSPFQIQGFICLLPSNDPDKYEGQRGSCVTTHLLTSPLPSRCFSINLVYPPPLGIHKVVSLHSHGYQQIIFEFLPTPLPTGSVCCTTLTSVAINSTGLQVLPSVSSCDADVLVVDRPTTVSTLLMAHMDHIRTAKRPDTVYSAPPCAALRCPAIASLVLQCLPTRKL